MEISRLGRSMHRLHSIMQTLRGPEGCPWDAIQTNDTLKPYLLEEVYELLEALDGGDPNQIRDELGDLLLQIAFHAQIFEERALFDLADVAEAISNKLERRHPHVFADSRETEIAALNRQWDRIKAKEKGQGKHLDTPLAGIPVALPALARAAKYLERAARRRGGTEPDTTTAYEAVLTKQTIMARLAMQSAERMALESAFGDFLLSAVAWGRSLELDAEQALRQALERAVRSFTTRE